MKLHNFKYYISWGNYKHDKAWTAADQINLAPDQYEADLPEDRFYKHPQSLHMNPGRETLTEVYLQPSHQRTLNKWWKKQSHYSYSRNNTVCNDLRLSLMFSLQSILAWQHLHTWRQRPIQAHFSGIWPALWSDRYSWSVIIYSLLKIFFHFPVKPCTCIDPTGNSQICTA